MCIYTYIHIYIYTYICIYIYIYIYTRTRFHHSSLKFPPNVQNVASTHHKYPGTATHCNIMQHTAAHCNTHTCNMGCREMRCHC